MESWPPIASFERLEYMKSSTPSFEWLLFLGKSKHIQSQIAFPIPLTLWCLFVREIWEGEREYDWEIEKLRASELHSILLALEFIASNFSIVFVTLED